VHAGDHDIELPEQRPGLVQRAVLTDVGLDPGQDLKRRQGGVQLADQLQLGMEPAASGIAASGPATTARRESA
jgi:hypothetical protein